MSEMTQGMLTVVTQERKEEFPIEVGVSVLQVLLDSGLIDITSPCGGNGLCGKCLVQVIGDDPFPIHPDERRILTSDQLTQHIRLACRMILPYVAHTTISLVNSNRGASVISTFQKNSFKTTIRKTFSSPSYGFAIDIGTTTIVVYLARIDTGEIIDHLSSMNPQHSYGGDVITRIQYANEQSNGLEVLQNIIVKKTMSLMDQLLLNNKLQGQSIYEIVAVGNPTMMHLFIGKDPSGIATAPFIPAFSEPLELEAKDIGLTHFPHATLILPGGVSAYIGSDITVGVNASNILNSTHPVLYIDIGTNGEIVLFDGKKLYCCSSAAGPAFEGASISQGMGALEGAIDRVWLDDSGNVEYSTIGGFPAIGICGSAIIDIVALMLDIGLVDETGAIDEEHPLAYKYLDGTSFRITDRVSFTYRDVREVQLAKAAIAAGCTLLIEHSKLEVNDIESVIIAGGFGSFINTRNARRIGLLVDIQLDKIIAVGNAAGRGALDVLLFDGEAENVEDIRKNAEYVELSTSSLFNQYYVEKMFFGEYEY
jgi:uncharacterized 2Fe-2S/4Fe-4S cluster protein (DUF4445 family)